MIVLDLSRLVSRAGRETPTGIDRVELAYAEHLMAGKARLCFTMLAASGRFGLLPRAGAEAYVDAVAGAWRGAPAASQQNVRAKRLARKLRLEPLLRGPRALHATLRSEVDRPVYLLVSHH